MSTLSRTRAEFGAQRKCVFLGVVCLTRSKNKMIEIVGLHPSKWFLLHSSSNWGRGRIGGTWMEAGVAR